MAGFEADFFLGEAFFFGADFFATFPALAFFGEADFLATFGADAAGFLAALALVGFGEACGAGESATGAGIGAAAAAGAAGALLLADFDATAGTTFLAGADFDLEAATFFGLAAVFGFAADDAFFALEIFGLATAVEADDDPFSPKRNDPEAPTPLVCFNAPDATPRFNA